MDVLMQAGLGRIKSNLASRVKKGKMTQEAANAVFSRVKGTLDYSGFGSVDMVSIPPLIYCLCLGLRIAQLSLYWAGNPQQCIYSKQGAFCII